MPSAEMLKGTPTPDCDWDLERLKIQYREAAAVLGGESVMMGSDFNGGIKHLAPLRDARCKTGGSFDTSGLWNISQIPAMWSALEARGAGIPTPRGVMIARFLEAWKQVDSR